jgi:uncharacterized membrane protein
MRGKQTSGFRAHRRRAYAALVIAIAITSLGGGDALGAPATIVLDGQPSLSRASSGASSASVLLTNLTDAAVRITANATGCSLSVGGGSALELEPARQTEVTVGIPESCAVASSFKFEIDPAGTVPVQVEAVASSAAKPYWSPLWSFLVALLVALIVVAVTYVLWPGTEPATKKGLTQPLKGLESSWSFKESWATNATAASGLFIGVIGSSGFLKAVLGPEAEAAIGVATVAGLIATSLVGAAGVLVLALRGTDAAETTVGGLLAGTVVALGAAGGQIWAITIELESVNLGVVNWGKYVVAVLASLLLALYAFTSIRGLLKQGREGEGKALKSQSALP